MKNRNRMILNLERVTKRNSCSAGVYLPPSLESDIKSDATSGKPGVSFCYTFLVGLLVILSSVGLLAQIPSGLAAQDSGNADFEVRVNWPENTVAQPEQLGFKGKINLTDEETVMVKLYAGSYSRSNASPDSIIGARIELIDLSWCSVKNGFWQVEFIQPLSPFQPDYYELAVLGQSIKQEYYFPLFAPHRFNERPQHLQNLQKILLELNGLEKELIEKINSLENIQVESPDSERIKKALGLHKTREELLKESIQKWSGWEKDWLNKLIGLINRIESEDIFLATRERLGSSAGELRLIYFQYRYYLFNDDKHLPPDVPKPTRTDWRFNNYQKLSALPVGLEKELLYRITKELMAQRVELIKLYQSSHVENKANKFGEIEADLVKLKNELQIYRELDLSHPAGGGVNQGGIPPRRDGEDNYQRLTNLLDLFSVLMKSMDSGLSQSSDEKLKYEIIKLNDLISRKIENIFANF
ncbi:MAG: hypothetical protein AAB019_04220 [Planctomycetota bacterium]